MIRPSGAAKNSSLRVRDHVGVVPPPVEIFDWRPGPGNGRTYTSSSPDSVDWYAIHRPSFGENIGARSALGPLRKARGFPGFHPDTSSPSISRMSTSSWASGVSSWNARNFPFGCHDHAPCPFLLSVKR